MNKPTEKGKTKNKTYETIELDYCDFNLKILAQKIKSQTYKPKIKMLYQ